MTNKTYTPGQIVSMVGIEFVVLDDFGEASDGSRLLFLVALKSQGTSTFGDTNNYAESALRGAVGKWFADLTDKLNKKFGCTRVCIERRTVDLTTLDGYKGYGTYRTLAAPLTMDEARKYAEVIPPPDEVCWLATGWGGPEHFGFTLALHVSPNGDWGNYYCPDSVGVRPALVAPASLLGDAAEGKPALEDYTTDDLLAEVRRRMKTK